MANLTNKTRLAQGINAGIIKVSPLPIISTRAPVASDKKYEIGQAWIDKTLDDVYFLTSVKSNVANWEGAAGGAGSFTSVTVNPGNFEVTAGAVTIGALTAGTMRTDASGIVSALADGTNGQLIIGKTGLAPAWGTLTAGGGINIVEGSGTITITNPGATGTTLTATDLNVVSPDGAGNTDLLGFDANITTDGATANTVKVRLSDAVTTVGKLTAGVGFEVASGVTTINSATDSPQAIYLHADGGTLETIDIRVDQGTNDNSLILRSDLGGVTLQSAKATGNAINLDATDAAGGLSSTVGTAGFVVTATNGPITFASGTGAVNIGADAAVHTTTIGSTTGSSDTTFQTGSGAMTFTGGGIFDVNATGALTLDSSGGVISVGADAVAQNINIGTAGARTISIGNSTGATAIDIDAGTGGLTIGSNAIAHTTVLGSVTGNSATTINAGTGLLNVGASGTDHTTTVGSTTGVSATSVQAGSGLLSLTGATGLLETSGTLNINSTAGALNIATGSNVNSINIGTDGSRNISIGNGVGSSSTSIEAGTGTVTLASNATDHDLFIGSITGQSKLDIRSGTDPMAFTAGGAFDVNATGALTLDSSGGAISVGADAVAQNINIGTAGARTIAIGNTTGATAINLVAGTGGVDIEAEAGGHIDIGTNAVIENINIGTGAAFKTIVIGNSSSTTSLSLETGTGDLNLGSNASEHDTIVGSITAGSATTIETGTGTMLFTANGSFDVNSVGAVAIDSSGATISIGADAVAQNISIGTAGARTITAGSSTAGTGIVLIGGDTGDITATPATNSAAAASITLSSKVGVVTLTGQTTASAAQETFTITNTEVSATSGILVTVANVGTNDARMSLERVKPASGSFEVMTQNNGGASLNGNVIISFWVLN